MLGEIFTNNERLILHTAWATDKEGENFSLEEFEEALYIGSYMDSINSESEDPKKYNWTEIDHIEDEDDEYDLESEEEYFDDEEISELKADIINASNHIENTQATTDVEVGNPNELEKTNRGTENWSSSEGYAIEEVRANPFEEKEVSGIKIICSKASDSGKIFFDIGKFKESMFDSDENSYTLSFDIKQSTLFNINAKIGAENLTIIDFGEIDVHIENEELDLTDEWNSCVKTGFLTSNTTESPKLIFDISKMPQSATIEIANLKIEEGANSTPYTEEVKGEKGEKGDPGEIPQEELEKINESKRLSEQANAKADEAQKKAKKVEDEQKKSVRNKIISEAGTYHGRIGITKKQFTFLPAWYGIFTSTTGGGAFESCPHTIRLSYISDGIKKSFVSEKKMWATPASMRLVGNEYDSKTAAEAAVRNFKANNIPPHSKWTMDDVALFVNKSDSRYIIQEYPRVLSYPGRVGKDYEIYCIVNKTDQGNYRIEIASYYQNDKPGDKDNYVLSKSSTQKLIIEYDMETTKVAKATEFGETTTATTKDVTVFGSYNDETSDDDATVFGNGTEESPQTAVSVKKNGDIVVKGTAYAQDFKIGEEFLSLSNIAYKVKKMDDEQSKPLLVTEAFDSDVMSFTAGTIGTIGVKKKISIAKDGYNPILVTIFYIASPTSFHPLVFFNQDRDSVYVSLYRAIKKSYGSENPVRFLVTYMRKK